MQENTNEYTELFHVSRSAYKSSSSEELENEHNKGAYVGLRFNVQLHKIVYSVNMRS